jgi:hypothetical protein
MYSNGEYGNVDPFDPRERSYGVLRYDRTHILNLSYNYSVPDLTKKGGVLGGILNGWQLSGITTWASGVPLGVSFSGDINSQGAALAWYGTPDHYGNTVQVAGSGSITPVFTCDPRLNGSKVGDKVLNINCIGIPALGQSGPFEQPYYMRAPNRANVDLSLFKNFPIGDKGARKIQLRFGAFNVFNQAVPNAANPQDIDLTLQTTCNVHVNGVPNGIGGTSDNICDPTKGFSFTQNTLDNFGKIVLKRGHRVIEFALKLYF